jgi:hypothetical protein
MPTLDSMPDPPVPVDRAGRPTVDADGDPIAVEDRVDPEEAGADIRDENVKAEQEQKEAQMKEEL